MHEIYPEPKDLKISVSAPYPEGAVTKLAKAWSENGSLRELFVPSRTNNRAVGRALSLVPRARGLALRVSRSVEALPERREVLPSLEIRRLINRALVRASLVSSGQSSWKMDFDKYVSTRVSSDTESILGMPDACLATFIQNSEMVRVFHSVDTHPEEHNASLLRHYSRRVAQSELHSTQYLDRVSAEIETADLILSPSSLVTTQMLKSGKHRNQVAQIPYGVDFTRFAPLRESVVDQKRERVFLYIGQISYRKGIPFLLEAFRDVDARLILVGPLTQPSLIENLPRNVQYRGVLPQDALSSELALADVFIFPSIEDACPLAVVEAAAAGLKVICTDSTGSAELLDSQDVSVVPAGDVEALRLEIERADYLSSDVRFSRANRIRAAAELDNSNVIVNWDRYAQKVSSSIASQMTLK